MSDPLVSCQPGDVLEYDYRPEGVAGTVKLRDTVSVVQWNIERGTKLEGIIEALKACQADIVVLQELDIDCQRSGNVNVPERLAQALCAQLLFVCEFEELDAPERSPHNAVGPLSNSNSIATTTSSTSKRHFHGNAILSMGVALREPTVLRHRAGLDWEAKGKDVHEPRYGFRSVLRVLIAPGDRQPRTLPPLYVYCCHLEVFCGALMRVRQLGDCLRDAQALLRAAKDSSPQSHVAEVVSRQGPLPAFIIAGDMNTMAHGIVRFSPAYATDRMRLLSLGESEACWWQRKVLSRGMGVVTRGCCPFSYRFPFFVVSRVYEWVGNNRLVWRLLYGFDGNAQRDLDNTKVCFYDPSDKATSITLNNPAYHGFVQGKLDWLLLSNLSVVPTVPETVQRLRNIDSSLASGQDTGVMSAPRGSYILFNEDYRESDHKGLLMTVRQNARGGPEGVYPEYGATYTASPTALGVFVLSRVVFWGLVGLAVHRASQGLLHGAGSAFPQATV